MNKDLLHLKRLFSKPFRAVRAGGQTNRNYVVTFQGKKLFVRLPWESSVLDRKAEGRNMLALSGNKKVRRILPRYYMYVLSKRNILNPSDSNRYDVPDGTMVTEYIPGREFTMKDFRRATYQKALARMFYIFHTSGVRFQNPYNVFRDEIRKYRRAAEKLSLKKFFNKATLAQLQSLERIAEKKLQNIKRGVAAHNDLIFQNFLIGKNGRLYLLDFEYAGRNTKGGIFYDIGYIFRDSFFNHPVMDKKTFERFLRAADKAYKRKFDREQIYWSVMAALLVGIWWGVLRFFDAPEKEQSYFSRYVQRGVRGVYSLERLAKRKESQYYRLSWKGRVRQRGRLL
jgi:thiamine kinase-like enzyme